MNPRGFLRVVQADLRGRRRLGTVLFVAVVGLASAAIVIGLASRERAGTLWDDAFARANAPHVIAGAGDPAALAGIAAEAGTIEAAGPIASVGGFQIDSEEVVARAASAAAPPTVGAPFVVEGGLARTPDEIAVESSFATEMGIAVGDDVELVRGAARVRFTVTGIVLDFQDCFFPNCDPGVTWVDPAGLDRLDTTARGYEVLLRLHDPQSAPTVAGTIAARYGALGVTTQDWLDTRGDALVVDDFFGAFLTSFGVFVLVAAGVVVAGAVTNRVLARRRDIGLLKSVGVTPRQVVAAMTVEHLLLAALGVLLGWLLAQALLPNLRIGVADVLGGGARVWSLDGFTAAVVAIGVIVVLATVLPTGRASRRSVAQTLTAGAGTGRRSRLARIVAGVGGGPVAIGGVKDAFGRPLRTVLAAASVVLAVVALLVTLGFDRTVDRALADPASTGDPWDVTVVPNEPGRVDDLVAAIEDVPQAAAWFAEAEERALVDGNVVLVRAVSGDPRAAAYVIRDGRGLTGPGEAIAGFGLLELLGKDVGDTVDVEIAGQRLALQIVGRYGETEDSGEVLQTRLESIQTVIPDARAEVVRVVAAPGVTPDALAAALAARLGASASVAPLESDADDFAAFRLAFWSVAVLVLVVALANLGATVLLGVRERGRELGTLRAVGYTPGQLVAATALGTGLVVAFALAVGVPVGLWVNDVLLGAVGEELGAGSELAAAPTALSVLATVVLVSAAAVGIAALSCAGTTRRTVGELVRYE